MPDQRTSALQHILNDDAAQVHVYRAPPGISSPSVSSAMNVLRNNAGLAEPDSTISTLVSKFKEYPIQRQETPGGPTCDRCNTIIEDVRLKCINCPDFDYCPECFLDANRIHPFHNFKALRKYEALSPEEEDFYLNLKLSHDETDKLPYLLRGRDTSFPSDQCPSCKKLVEEIPLMQWFRRQNASETRQSQAQAQGIGFSWPIRLSRLAEATAMGCSFCTYILEKFFGPGNAVTFAYSPERPWYTNVVANSSRLREVLENVMMLVNRLPHDRFSMSVAITGDNTNTSNPRLAELTISVEQPEHDMNTIRAERVFAFAGNLSTKLQVFATEGDPASIDVSNRPPNARPSSNEAFVQVKKWISECTLKHGGTCSVTQDQRNYFPSRILDVSNGALIRLCESIGHDSDPYVALSYQWGGPQDFQATTKSLPHLMEGFSVAELPATIVDAVKVTRELGIKYLWVDSLCILQDDENDKAHEISRMDNIYRFAFLTLIAAKAFEVNEGFLQSKTDSETGLWKPLIPLGYHLFNSSAHSLEDAQDMRRQSFGTIWLMDETEFMSSHTFKSPVDRRSWCLQERLLSPRVLNYGRWTTWRCGKTIASDGGFYPYKDNTLAKQDEFARHLLRLTQQSGSKPDIFTLSKLLQTWYGVVNDYTKRDIGIVSDRLPAIGGMASLIHQATGMQYVAGLWHDNLLHDMMWYADTREWLNRPATGKAPTWSWASVECAVTYEHIDENATPLATVLNVGVDAGKAGLYGEIQSGQLRIRGSIRELPREDVLNLMQAQGIAPSPPKADSHQEWFRQIMEYISNTERAKNITMEQVAEELPDHVFAFITFEHDERIFDEVHQKGQFFSGLLLRQVDDHYERIGSFKREPVHSMSFADEQLWQEETISIH